MSTSVGSSLVIAIFGANGNISSNVISHIEKLLANGTDLISDFTLRIITRDPENLLTKVHCMKTEIIAGSINDTDRLDELLMNVHRAFFCLPQHLSSDEMLATSNRFTDAAKRAGVQTVVRISSYGMDNKSATEGSQGTLGKAHVEGEEYMRANGLTVTSVRPTSFFSNFLKYDYPSVNTSSTFYSPLGKESSVNWISCDDISSVVARALLDYKLDGKVLDITGSDQNTLTAENMRILLQKKFQKDIIYVELPIPENTEMNGLWLFLRAGGFSHHTNTVEEITGKKPIEFSDFLDTLLK